MTKYSAEEKNRLGQTSEMMRKCCNKAVIDTEYISSCLATQLCLVQSSQFWCLH